MTVTSQLEAVTVYASGAVCTRRAKVDAPPEPTRQIRITGLPLSLRATSLRARVLSGGEGLRVLDVRAGFEVQLAEEVDVPVEQKALEAAEAEVSRLEQVQARLVKEAQELGALRPSFPVQKKGEPPRTAPVDAMLGLADFVDRELETRNGRLRKLEQELTDARNEAQLRRRRLHEASTTNRTERARLSRSAVVMLSAEHSQALELAVEYQVPGARWVPSYELRLDKSMNGGGLKMRASVAQHTGEDWINVALSLSTAQLDRRTDLPELRAMKIGRSQPPPPRPGWREPPPGLDELFEGYDEAMGGRPPVGMPPPPPKAAAPRDFDDGAAPERSMKKRAARSTPPPGMPQSAPAPAPSMARMSVMAPMAMPVAAAKGGGGVFGAIGNMVGGRGGARSHDARREEAAMPEADMAMDDEVGEAPSGAMAMPAEAPPPELVPDHALMDYDRLQMQPSTDGRGPRGRLKRGSDWQFAFVSSVSVQVDIVTAVLMKAQREAGEVENLTLPHHASAVRASAAAFDYRFECESKVEVPSTGRWSLVPVMTAQVGLNAGYTCVPSVEPKVYRVLKVANKSPHALLQGPVDVSMGDEFLMTTQLPTIAPRGEEARLGLGVEEALKVARKTQFKETTGGLLGGSTVLPHEIEIEVSNRLSHPAAIEIRERVPVSRDDDVKVEEASVKPPWEKDEKIRDGVQTDGARRWLVTVGAGEKATVVAQFNIKMPSDKMLIGGNRRV